MSKTTPTIRGVKARAIVAPIARPVKNAFGSIEAAPLVLIDVATDQGITGRSYIFAYTALTLKPLVHLIDEIGRELVGHAIAPFDLMSAMDARFRLLGWQGLVGMAVSGLDMAFWDGLGKIAGKPLVELLGGSVRPIKAYDSYGAVDPKADERDLRRSLELGFRGIKIKGGLGDCANDERIVKGVRALLGPDIALMIDFNQSLDPDEASRRKGGIDSDVQSSFRRGERAYARCNSHGALARSARSRSQHPGRPDQDQRRHVDSAWTRPRT
jgi:mandelate racemase